MRRPSGRMTPNVVTLRRIASWSKDSGGGRQPVYASDSLPVRCAVQPTSSEDRPQHMRETLVVYDTVKFYDDPNLNVRDLVLFDGRTKVVVGVRATSGGAGRTWLVDTEERPVGRG